MFGLQSHTIGRFGPLRSGQKELSRGSFCWSNTACLHTLEHFTPAHPRRPQHPPQGPPRTPEPHPRLHQRMGSSMTRFAQPAFTLSGLGAAAPGVVGYTRTDPPPPAQKNRHSSLTSLVQPASTLPRLKAAAPSVVGKMPRVPVSC